ncbi:portal protein [Kiloniella laminariae]|uniref:portal protein n=1 Tax=Kiloniella laminariae TaxID=454162 RepID=UPI0012F741D8|nr:portal protein [Kiloniella laminariae]
MELAEKVINRQSVLQQERQKFEKIWRETAERLDPFGSVLEGSIGDMSKMYSSRPLQDLARFAAAIESLLIPRGSIWHGLEPMDDELKQNDEVQVWAEAQTKKLFAVRYMAQSGFVANTQRMFRSLGCYGNQVMMTEEVLGRGPGGMDLPPIRYRMIPMIECFLATTAWGQIDTFYRVYKLTLRQMIQEFGEENLPEFLKVRMDKPDILEQKFEIIHAIDTSLADGVATQLPWPSVHVLKGQNHVLRQSGYYEFPIHASSFVESDGHAYGWGPGMMALPDIKQLNIMNKTTIAAAEQAVSPAFATVQKLKRRLNLSAGAINPDLITEDGRLKIQPIATGVRPDIGEQLIAKKQADIGANFYVDLWQILVNKPDMTAYEAALRAQEKSELIGPPFAKQEEMLASIVMRENAILERQAADGIIDLPPRPEILQGRKLSLKFTSPMAKLRRAAEDAGIQRTLETAAQQAQFDPSIMDNFDHDRIIRARADINGMPADLLNPIELVEARRQARAQAEQQQAMAAQQAQSIDMAGKALPVMEAMGAAGIDPAALEAAVAGGGELA